MLLGAIAGPTRDRLEEMNEMGGFPMSLVCDEGGLLLTTAGDGADEDQLAGLTSLFDDIVTRADRDIGMHDIDEVSLVDAAWGRCVIRPIGSYGGRRWFLVCQVPRKATWRMHTNRALRQIAALMAESE
jgi:hypothetical protein